MDNRSYNIIYHYPSYRILLASDRPSEYTPLMKDKNNRCVNTTNPASAERIKELNRINGTNHPYVEYEPVDYGLPHDLFHVLFKTFVRYRRVKYLEAKRLFDHLVVNDDLIKSDMVEIKDHSIRLPANAPDEFIKELQDQVSRLPVRSFDVKVAPDYELTGERSFSSCDCQEQENFISLQYKVITAMKSWSNEMRSAWHVADGAMWKCQRQPNGKDAARYMDSYYKNRHLYPMGPRSVKPKTKLIQQ